MLNSSAEYLDTQKSVMISSPAGSGKTEKLSRRYIALLKSGSQVERILAITFTEKAAAEMKERIINILSREDPELFEKLKSKIPRMRISTIHAFCRKILKRFSIELGLDTDMDVMDEFQAKNLWTESVYQALMLDADADRLFQRAVSRLGIKGWGELNNALDVMHSRRIVIQSGLGEKCIDIAGKSSSAKDLLDIYIRCLDQYTAKKRAKRLLDFNDLELIAYDAISSSPEWHNILFSFDEHTDHMLVDEFQDTSTLQWKIIDKLTEEWRSGLGAKRSSGQEPTIFLVGDDKQSIYSFRGADVEIFRNTRKRLDEWLGSRYSYIEIKENFRSLPAVVNFVNDFFSRYMSNDIFGGGYRNFEPTRTGEGHVELIMINSSANSRENRKLEAQELARRIIELHGAPQSNSKKYTYGDMAVLFRKRTHLALFEEAFKQAGVPFVVLKGIGFYSTPEVNLMNSLVFFLIDPSDDYSLFNLLRSKIFNIGYKDLKSFLDEARSSSVSMPLFDHMQTLFGSRKPSQPQQIKLWNDNEKVFLTAYNQLTRWLEILEGNRISLALEQLLADSGAWRHLSDRQRYLNVRKFIRVVEEMESRGFSRAEIKDNLIVADDRTDEPKANVNAEGMDAVRIMTIHAAKGLQFPVVFLPCLDEKSAPKSQTINIFEQNGRVTIDDGGEDGSSEEIKKMIKARAAEEDKRLFYVAATRAMDRLYMSGVSGNKPSEKLGALVEEYGLDLPPGACPYDHPFVFTSVDPAVQSNGKTAASVFQKNKYHDLADQMVHTGPIAVDSPHEQGWTDVTEEIQRIGRHGSEEWAVQGRAFHRIFELISSGATDIKNIDQIISSVLHGERLSSVWYDKMFLSMKKDITGLVDKGYYDSILQKQASSFFELPFVLKKSGRTFRGRIDRVIIKDCVAHIYDYKTFPVRDDEIFDIAFKYSGQINLYRDAVEKIFSCPAKAYILFTNLPNLVQL
ncbi:MAG: UvrD-helicase domain-containing protein [Nitrospirae bacterium]|nr:UvrD-helicase domain-containing protein [Nitrospirota bacterium]